MSTNVNPFGWQSMLFAKSLSEEPTSATSWPLPSSLWLPGPVCASLSSKLTPKPNAFQWCQLSATPNAFDQIPYWKIDQPVSPTEQSKSFSTQMLSNNFLLSARWQIETPKSCSQPTETRDHIAPRVPKDIGLRLVVTIMAASYCCSRQ